MMEAGSRGYSVSAANAIGGKMLFFVLGCEECGICKRASAPSVLVGGS